MPTRRQEIRDAALLRLRRINRTIAVAAVVGAGVLTDAAAHTPRHSAHTGYRVGAATGSAAAPVQPAQSAPAQSQPAQSQPAQSAPVQPAQSAAVQPTQSPPIVQSGGS